MGDSEPILERGPAGRGWRPSSLLVASGGVHVGALAGLALQPHLWPWLASSLVANHALLAGAGLTPRCGWLGPNLTRLERNRSHRSVALTFDDGPHPEITPAVLDLLSQAGARASFFLIGVRAQRYPDLVREIVRRGHRVENHTYEHPLHFALLGPRAQADQIDRAQELLSELAGTPPAFLRAPAGLRNLWLDRLLFQRGLRLASWTRRGFDTADRNVARVGRRLLRHLNVGDILLLHDGHAAASRRAGRPMVLEVLPRILETLAHRGLSGCALPREGAAEVAMHAATLTDDE